MKRNIDLRNNSIPVKVEINKKVLINKFIKGEHKGFIDDLHLSGGMV
jgi:hypothetical protein